MARVAQLDSNQNPRNLRRSPFELCARRAVINQYYILRIARYVYNTAPRVCKVSNKAPYQPKHQTFFASNFLSEDEKLQTLWAVVVVLFLFFSL